MTNPKAAVVKIEAPDDRYLPGYKQGLKSIGPRLVETRVAFSLYGTPIPLSFGTRPIEGNILWSKELTEVPVVENQTTRYTYYGTFAVSFGYAGNADATKRQLLRVWADGRLILDNRANGRAVARSFRYRWYDGSETQEPDPTILADKGSDNTPAFRGQMYMVITDLPLWAFDNKIPFIQVEVGDVDATANLVTTITATGEGSNRNRVHVNWDTDRAYVVNTGLSPTGMFVYDLSADSFLGGVNYNRFGVPQSHFTGVFIDKGIDPVVHELIPWLNAFVGVPDDNAWTTNTPMIIDADTGNVISYMQDAVPQPFMFRVGHLALPRQLTCIASVAATGNDLTFLGFDGANLTRGYQFDSGYDNSSIQCFGKATTVDIQYYIAPSAGDVVHRMIITEASFSSNTPPIYDATWLPYDGVATTTVRSMVYCPNQNALLVFYASGEARLVDVDTGSNIWRLTGLAAVPSTNDGTGCLQNGDQSNSLVTYVKSNTVYEIDLAKGTFRTFALAGNLIASDSASFDSSSYMVVGRGTVDDKVRKIKYEYAAASEISIADLITQVALRNGYSASDIVVDAGVTATINGAVFTEAISLAELNEILKTLYGYDIRESGGKIYVNDTFNNYTTPVFTIDQDDLLESDNPFSERREPDTPIPRTYAVKYISSNLGYEWATQVWGRDRDDDLHSQEGRNELTVPFIMTDAKAKEAAFRATYAGVVNKESYSFGLGQEFLDLEPGDVISATVNGKGYLIRPLEVNYDTNFTLTIQGERFQSYEAVNIEAFGGYPYTGEVKRDFKAFMFAFGVPYLFPQDIPSENYAVFYYVISPGEVTTTFTGVYGSLGIDVAGTVAWRKLQFSDFAVPVGFLTTPFEEPAIGCEHALDTINTINMVISSGDPDLLTAATMSEMYDGANLAIVGSPNRWEIIRWMDIGLEADGTYTISNILRGCYNTERAARNLTFDIIVKKMQYVGGSSTSLVGPPEREYRRPKFLNASKAGDVFIPLDDAWLKKEVLDMDDSALTFKTVASNRTDGLLGNQAIDLFDSEVSPAPTDIRVTRDTNGFLSVTWSPVFKHVFPLVDDDSYGQAIRNEMNHYAIYVWVPPYSAAGPITDLATSLLLETDEFSATYEDITGFPVVADQFMEGEFAGKISLTTTPMMANKPPNRTAVQYGLNNSSIATLSIYNMPFVYMASHVATDDNAVQTFTFPYHCPVVDIEQTGSPDYPSFGVGTLAGVPSDGMRKRLGYSYVYVAVKRLMRSSPKQATIGTDLRPHAPLKVGYTGGSGNPSSYTAVYAGRNDNTVLQSPGVFYTTIINSDLANYNDVRGGQVKWVKCLVKDV